MSAVAVGEGVEVRVLVTGGAGFIGANLVRRLCRESDFDDVRVLDDLSTGSLESLRGVGPLHFERASVLDRQCLDEAMDGVDAVVHLAARPSVARSLAEPLVTHENNATGTLEVLEAARRAGGVHVLVASSSSVYGASRRLPKSESHRPVPLSPYAVSKLATETYALAYQHCFGLPVLAFRFFNVFGPLQPADHAYAAVIPTFLDAALAARALPVHGDGLQTRDFTYVESLVDIVIDAIRRRVVSDEPVNLAFGGRRTLLEVVAALETVIGHSVELSFQAPRPGDVRDSQADATRLLDLFPEVEPVEFVHGLRATHAWFRAERDARGLPLAAVAS